jgi:hypothetical protein
MLPRYPRSRLLVASTRGIGSDSDHSVQLRSHTTGLQGNRPTKLIVSVGLLHYVQEWMMGQLVWVQEFESQVAVVYLSYCSLGRSLDEYDTGPPGSASKVE